MLLFPIRPPRRVAYMPGSFFMSLRERCGVAPGQNGWAQALITGWESPCAAAFWATQVSPLRCGVWRQNLRIARNNAKGCRGETCLARLTGAHRARRLRDGGFEPCTIVADGCKAPDRNDGYGRTRQPGRRTPCAAVIRATQVSPPNVAVVGVLSRSAGQKILSSC